MDPETFMGALNSAGHLDKVRRCVAEAVAEGAIVQCGHTKEDLTLPQQNKNVSLFIHLTG